MRNSAQVSELTIHSRGEEMTVALERQFILGSRPDADVVVPEPHVAPTHVIITPSQRGALLLNFDVDGRVGVLVNGVRSGANQRLNHGDRIQVGSVSVTYLRPALEGTPQSIDLSQLSQEEETGTHRWAIQDSQQINLLQGGTEAGRAARTLYRLSSLAFSSSSEAALLDGALQLAIAGCEAQSGAIVYRDEAGELLPSNPPDPSNPPLIDRAQVEAALDRSCGSRGLTRGSPAACAPVGAPGTIPEAAMCLVRQPKAAEFSQAELELLAAVGRQLGWALERVRLLKQLRASQLDNSRLQRRFEAVLSTLSEGIVLVDSDLMVEPLSARASELLERVLGRQPALEDGRPRLDDVFLGELTRVALDGGIPPSQEWESERGDFTRVTFSRIPALDAVALVLSDVTELRRREEEHSRIQSRLEREVLEISAREQQRIGQDLHDGLSQLLFGISLHGKGLEEDLRRQGRPEADQAAEIQRLLEEAVEKSRNLAKRHCPVTLEEDGLQLALQEMMGTFRRLHGDVDIDFTIADDLPPLDQSSATHFYHLAQEAVSNALKHAQADRVHLLCRALGDGGMLLQVDDDGVGLGAPASPNGIGLGIMRYRATTVGARLVIGPGEGGRGTRVSCELPGREEAS